MNTYKKVNDIWSYFISLTFVLSDLLYSTMAYLEEGLKSIVSF